MTTSQQARADVPGPKATAIIAAIGFEPADDEVSDLEAQHAAAGLTKNVEGCDAEVSATQSVFGAEGYLALLEQRSVSSAAQDMLDFVGSVFGSDTDVELRALDPKGRGARSCTGRVGHEGPAMLQFLLRHDGTHNLYVGVNPRSATLRGSSVASSASDVTARRFVVFDFDNKDAGPSDPNWQVAVKRLQALAPRAILHSGNGTHVWFEIDPIVEPGQIAGVSAALADAMRHVGADPSMADAPRITRLPSSINIPGARKRARGARLALAQLIQGPDLTAPKRTLSLLIQAVTGSPPCGKPSQAGAASRVGKEVNSMPPEMLQAPAANLLRNALAGLPNDDSLDRDYQVRVAHAVVGASKGTDFESKGREYFLDWSAKYPDADVHADAQLYDKIRTSGRGWPHLMKDLGLANPSGRAQISLQEAPFRRAAVQAAFANAPIPPEQAHLVDMTPISDVAAAADVQEVKASLRASKAQDALNCLRQNGADLFQSPNGRAWIGLCGRIHRLDSEVGFRAVVSWLTVNSTYSITGNAKTELKDLLLNLAFAGPKHRVHYRQTQLLDAKTPQAFLNLMNEDAEGVVIDGTGWSVLPVSAMPVRFTDRSKGLPLPIPVRADDGLGLFDRIGQNIPLQPVHQPDDPSDPGVRQRAGLLMFLLNQVYRAGSAVHLFLNAPQGSGKTVTSLRIKDLVDPDTAAVVRALPTDEATLYSIAQQQSLLALDNVSSMSGDAADVLCGLATGQAQQKRGLYTDDERVVYEAKCSIIINSIRQNLITRPDLADRIVSMDLPLLDPKTRRTEQELIEGWHRDKPHLLADLLDALAGGLAGLERVVAQTLPENLPRFADAALLAEAAAQAMGWKPGLCLAAINDARQDTSDRQLEDNPYTFRVRAMLQRQGGSWTGTTAQLRAMLSFDPGPEWGTLDASVQAFTSAIDRMAGPLRDAWNIHTTRSRGHSGRSITLATVKS